MKHLAVLAIGTCALAMTATASAQTAAPAVAAPGKGQSADARARAVLAKLTLDEKLAMLSGTFGASVLATNPNEKRIGAGHVPGVPRLGIPDLWESDASLGVANGGEMRKGDVATALPSSLATAASFDPAIARAGGAMIGSEARAKGFNVLLAGGVNLIRDPWGGRAFEYLSEDVLLSGVMAGESIAGIQSNGIVSTIKHYALNPQESGRYVVNGRIGEAALRESDLLAFQIGIERGHPGSVMCGYNKVNGDWACENDWLLNTVLKKDWSYPGWVMSDWGAVHSTEKAALAGLDQQSGRELDKQPYFVKPLREAVAAGRVSVGVIDDKVLRILRMMFEHGLVDNPPPATPTAINYAENAKVAQRAAEAGIVLLKNESALLPLAASAGRIAVIGGHADVGVLSGAGSSQVRSVGGNVLEIPLPGAGPFSGLLKRSYHASSPLQAIGRRVGADKVRFVSGDDVEAAVKAAQEADIAVVFADEWRTEILDQESLNLTPAQERLIQAVAKANPRTVVVLETGGPVVMPWLSQVGAVMEAWYPGQNGGEAIARVLFGEVNPSGRLPVTFPASSDQPPRPEIPGLAQAKTYFENLSKNPPTDLASLDLTGGMTTFPVDYVEGADVGYRWYSKQGRKPAFAFGHGLSYTSFGYGGLALTGGAKPVARFTLRNTGNRAGAEVAQVYGAAAGQQPRLVGFVRVELARGESRQVAVPLDWRTLRSYDTTGKRWITPAGPVKITIGGASDDAQLSGETRAK